MRDLVYLVATSLDGFIAAENGDTRAFLTEGAHIDALVNELPETLPGPFLQAIGRHVDEPSRFDTVLMGWATYQLGLDAGITRPYPLLSHVVFSRNRTSPDPAVRVTSQPPSEVVRALKREPGKDIWLCGGATLAAALAADIDRLVIKSNPVLLGSGLGLFGHPLLAPSFWQLCSTRSFRSGVTFSEYRRLDDDAKNG